MPHGRFHFYVVPDVGYIGLSIILHPKIFRFIYAPPRYYLAEGVRIYSQETWKMVTALEEGGGRQVVIDHIDSVVSYYITSTKYVCLRLLSILGRGGEVHF